MVVRDDVAVALENDAGADAFGCHGTIKKIQRNGFIGYADHSGTDRPRHAHGGSIPRVRNFCVAFGLIDCLGSRLRV